MNYVVSKNKATLFAVSALALLFFLLLGSMRTAHALDLSLSPMSPAPGNSVQQWTSTEDVTKHLLIRSNHGNVRSITLGLYYSSPGAHVARIYNPGLLNGGVCDIHQSSLYKYMPSHPYITVIFSAPGQSVTYMVHGPDVCNATFAGNTIGNKDNAQLYGGYQLPAALGSVYDNESEQYKVKMTIKFSDELIYDGSQQQLNFMAQATAGLYAGNIDTSTSTSTVPNNSVAGKFEGGVENLSQFFPFGLSCADQQSKQDAAVSVYDADNLAGDATPVFFYVAKVLGPSSISPLAHADYTRDSLGRVIISGGHTDNSYGYPVFYPDNFGGAGGTTTVRIDNLPSLRNDPSAHYVLVVRYIHTNGAKGPNNFIYVGTPGDGIFGTSNFKCRAKMKPKVSINPASGLTAGGNATLKSSLTNTGGRTGTVNSYTVKYWYSNSGSGVYGVGDSAQTPLTHSTGWSLTPGATVNPSSDLIANLPPGYKFLCATIAITSVDANSDILAGNTTCSAFVTTFEPYLSIYGGDALTGASPQVDADGNMSCAQNDQAGFLGWNTGAPGWAGAGAQFAVQAMGNSNMFASGLGGVHAPSDLFFANAGNGTPGGDTYGGNFGSTANINCDFTSDLDPLAASPGAVHARTLTDGMSEKHYYKGDVYIDGPITYGYSNGVSWPSVTSIPSYKLVVIGNIYIAPNVQTLSGTYVAIPDPDRDSATDPTGVIETCATNGSSLNIDRLAAGATGYYNTCHSQLTIYGSFVAKQVRFDRTVGNLATDATAATNNYAQSPAAEKFIYSPEIWMKSTAGVPSKNSSYVGRPPVL